MSSLNSISSFRLEADSLFESGEWSEALQRYQQLPEAKSSSVVQLRIAECCYFKGQYELAFEFAERACRQHRTLARALHIQSLAAKALGRPVEWLSLANACYQNTPSNPEFELEFAHALMMVAGDSVGSRDLAAKWLEHADHAERAHWILFLSQVYDRPDSMDPLALSQQFVRFAARFLATEATRLNPIKAASPGAAEPTSLRVGFVGSFSRTPSVFFMCLKTFKELAAKGHKLVFFSRQNHCDSVSQHFCSLNIKLVECDSFSPQMLLDLFNEHALDELYDLGGIHDPAVLKAIAYRPARRVFSWFGGQLCTTGLRCYDGLISDSVITPPSVYGLYSERLISLGSIQSMYVPPAYLPSPRERVGKGKLTGIRRAGRGVIGVCSPPMYLSRAFLTQVKKLMGSMPEGVIIVFIDASYASEQARSRIRKSIPLEESRLQFLAVQTHQESVEVMNDLDLLLDTFPHSSGVRLMEAMYLKLPVHVFPSERKLFCERQALAFTDSK